METQLNPLTYLANCAQSMESNPPPSPPSSSPSPQMPPHHPSISKSPTNNGYLLLEGNPSPWINHNSTSSHHLVKHLVLDFNGIHHENDLKIDDSIDKLTFLTHLTIYRAKSLESLPNSISTLRHIQFLKFEGCGFQQLPANLGFLKNTLTNLTLVRCNNIKSLPRIVANLSNLTSLHLQDCDSLTELNPNLEHLSSLAHLSLSGFKIKSLPKIIASLPNLTSLHLYNHSVKELKVSFGKLGNLKGLIFENCDKLRSIPDNISCLVNLESLSMVHCDSLTELPSSLEKLVSLKHFSIDYCSKLQSLPSTMSNLLNLESLSIEGSDSLKELPENLKITYLELVNSSVKCIPRGLVNLRHLEVTPNIRFHSDCSFANLKDSVKLQILSFCRKNHSCFYEFPDDLEGLGELILLNIQETKIKYLPWSITELNKLRYLILPRKFRLETLPFHLDDSILISVEGRHVRKPWKQLKQEIGVSEFPIAEDEDPSIIPPPNYLSTLLLRSNLDQWIRDYHESWLRVKMLDVDSTGSLTVKNFKSAIEELSNLTHLFVTNGNKRCCLPRDMTRLKHLCLDKCCSMFYSYSLHYLSNLKTLDLISTPFAINSILPRSLTYLSLHCLDICSLPVSISSLYNLQTLELSECYNITSLSTLKIVNLKIDRIIESLPIGLRHLEILHVKKDCGHICCNVNRLEHCLAQLVNLETLSLTCYYIKSLPSMAGQRNLQVLLLKDCFALNELLPDLEHLIKLQTLDISGTRIKSLPNSIIKLSNLQQLVLPKCFTQKLAKKIVKLSNVDETDRSYYKQMGYYDSDFETISDSSYEGNDDDDNDNDDDDGEEVGSIEGFDQTVSDSVYEGIDGDDDVSFVEEFYEENVNGLIQGVVNDLACEQNDVIAEVPRVTRSTSKRRENDRAIEFPPSKKRKQFHDTEEKEPISDSFSLEKTFEPAHRHERKVSKAMETVRKSRLESVKTSHMEVPRHVEVHLDGANQSNNAQPNGNSSSFDFVKACYGEDQVWINFSLNSSFDHLNESICKKFNLEVNKFKIKFLDVDEEWSLMTCISDLINARLHTSSFGRIFVRLSITDSGVVNKGQASEENNRQIFPKKSKGKSTRSSIQSERQKSKYVEIESEGETSNSDQPSIKDCIQFPDIFGPHIKPLIEGFIDVKADGNCGFRVIATFEYGDEEKWLDVRIDLLNELNNNKDLYKRALGGNQEFERACSILNWLVSPADKMHCFEATCLGLVVATRYQRVFTCWSSECCTYLPLVSRLFNHKPPTEYINMAVIYENQFVALQMPKNIPLPPLSPLWKRHGHDKVKHWRKSIFKKKLDQYLRLCD